jgi:2-oxoglutarate ferredoxin oxidoreductase subunit delta
MIHVVATRCKGCGFCIAFCPPKVLSFSTGYNPQGYHFPELANPDGCTGCDLCGLYCPDFAIHGVMLKYAAKTPPRAPAPNSAEGASQ